MIDVLVRFNRRYQKTFDKLIRTSNDASRFPVSSAMRNRVSARK